MTTKHIRFLTFCCAAIFPCAASNAVTPLSQYGQIQNVQNYSSNPFWSPGQQYNKRIMPSPVYATGPAVETSDCQNIVANLVAVQCATQNNCTNMRVSDIRPAVIVGLSRLPGNNFASSCSGYIDSAFEAYVNQHTNTVQPTAFPASTDAASTQPQNEFKINNPYEIKTPTWASEAKERANQMQQLQSQDAENTNRVTAAAFPTTINDVSFEDRMNNLAAGYAPYKDASAYNSIKVESPEDALARQLETLEKQRAIDATTLSKEEYCDKYPLDDQNCVQTPGLEEQIIAIGNAPTTQTPPQSQSQTPSQQTPHPQKPTPQTPQKPTTTPSANNTVIANNTTRGGPCTPSSKSDWFPNKILTSGRYESIDPAFEKAMVQFFRMEGECGYHPADSGGYTCYGFAQNYNPDIDVRKLTRAGAEDRTYERIYKANGIDKLPDSVRGDVLRGWFGSGYYGVQQMQKVLGLPLTKTGKVDDAMVAAAMNYQGDLHQKYWDQMQEYYINITRRKPSQKVFLKGWMNGVKLMRENGCHVEPIEPLTR